MNASYQLSNRERKLIGGDLRFPISFPMR